jgi:hypothetical protein
VLLVLVPGRAAFSEAAISFRKLRPRVAVASTRPDPSVAGQVSGGRRGGKESSRRGGRKFSLYRWIDRPAAGGGGQLCSALALKFLWHSENARESDPQQWRCSTARGQTERNAFEPYFSSFLFHPALPPSTALRPPPRIFFSPFCSYFFFVLCLLPSFPRRFFFSNYCNGPGSSAN